MDRTERIAEEIKKVISEMIQNELKDPRVKGLISVTKVLLTKDLKFCKIYVSVMGSDEEKQNTIKALKSATGYIKKEIATRLNLRIVPEPNFVLDTSIDYGMHINELLNKINGDK